MPSSSLGISHSELGYASNDSASFSFNGVIIDKKLVKQDVRSLLLSYISLNTTSFERFRDLWYKVGFSLVHYVCIQRCSRAVFLEYVYNTILSYSLVAPTSCGRAGVVYALYLLRESEPLTTSTTQAHLPIPIVNRIMYNELKESYQIFSTEKLIEPLLILRYLFQNDAFCYIHNNAIFSIDDTTGSELSQALASPVHGDPRYPIVTYH